MILVLFSVMTIMSNTAFAICAVTPTVMVAGSGTDLAGLCTAISADATALSTADIDIATAATAASTSESLVKQAAQYSTQLEQYAQELLSAQNLIIQTEMMVKELEENPLQVIVPDANQLIANQKRIDSLAKDIANNSSSIGTNLMNDITHPNTLGLGQGSRFALWSEARIAGINEAFEKDQDFIRKMKKEQTDLNRAIKNQQAAVGKKAIEQATADTLSQMLSMLQRMESAIQQQMKMQATENAMKQEQDNAAATAIQSVIKTPPGSGLIFKEDGYKGPGKVGNKGF